ncbi:hypothetical protein BKA93DRAFT_753343 [Sparassis latifolia]
MPVSENATADGSSDEYPLRLEGVAKEEFVQLVRVMCPRLFSMWNLERIRKKSFRNQAYSTQDDPVGRLVLSKRQSLAADRENYDVTHEILQIFNLQPPRPTTSSTLFGRHFGELVAHNVGERTRFGPIRSDQVPLPVGMTTKQNAYQRVFDMCFSVAGLKKESDETLWEPFRIVLL